MTYFYREEPANIPYSVKVTPGPTADEATASLRKGRPDGSVAKVEQLSRQGSGVLQLDLQGFELKDSPIFIEFCFKSDKGKKVRKTTRAVSLADAVPAKIDPEVTQAKKGDKVKLKVCEWAALVYDSPGKASEAQEPDAERVPAAVKSKVKWKLDGKDLPDTGAEITVDVKEEHEGKVLEVEAYIESASGRAKATIDCFVLEVQLHDEVYQTCPNLKYKLTLEDGTVLDGSADGQGWIKRPIPYKPQRIKVAYTPKGQDHEEEISVRITNAGPDADDFYLAHVENLGYGLPGEPPEAGIVRLQAARGVPLSGQLDDETKNAIKALVKKDDQQSLKKGLFDD
jgi:hypothetical protein